MQEVCQDKNYCIKVEDDIPTSSNYDNNIKVEDISTPPNYNIKVEECCIPPDDDDDCVADEINPQLLPDKSRAKYEATYLTYKKWQTSENIKLSSEDTLMHYFKQLSQTHQPSTLWTKWSMLKTTLNQNECIDINQYQQLKAFLKGKSRGYKCKKPKALSARDIDRFIREAPDDKYLPTKVALIFGISGACRLPELVNIKSKDVQHQGDLIVVKIPGTKPKVPRTIIIEGAYVALVTHYESMRPWNPTTGRFFLNYQNGKCTTQSIGINKFGAMPKRIAEYLQLPDANLYTGHSFRRTSATLLAANSAATDLLTGGGGKYRSISTVADSLIQDSIQKQREIEQLLIQSSVSDDMAEVSQDTYNIKVEEICPPPLTDLPDYAPEDVNTQLLPDKSRAKYEMTYLTYKKWQTSKHIKVTSENALMVYFKELAQTYQPSTLWSKWSMMKAIINQNEGIDINQYQQLKGFLKRKAHGYKCKKSKALSAKEIDRFITEAPNDKYLVTKVALIFGICGACRLPELVQITSKDVQHQGNLFVVKIPVTKTKVPRTFIIEGELSRLVKNYESLRPSDVTTDRFFLNYQNGKCTSQPIGINKFGAMPKRIAEYLKLPDASLYTGHSFRRTSAILLAQNSSGSDLITLKGNTTSERKTDNLMDHSIDSTREIEHLIQSSVSDMQEVCQDNYCLKVEEISLSPNDIKVEETYMPLNDIKIEECYEQPLNEIKIEDIEVEEICTLPSDNPDCETDEMDHPQLLPDKSRARYELIYLAYKKWQISKNIKLTTEKVLMVYFKQLSQTHQPSTLWSKWSMMKTTLNQKERIDINQYQQLKSFLKRKAHGYKCKKSKVLSAVEIDRFITEAPNDKYLATKVALIFGISGACRLTELVKIMSQDVQRQGDLFVVKIPLTKTKVPRTFILEGKFSQLVEKYESLRPANINTHRFFINHQNGRCTTQPLGLKTFGAMPRKIAEYLKLPNASLYTGHSFRRTSATLLAKTGGDSVSVVKRKSSTVAECLSPDFDEVYRENYIKVEEICVSPSPSDDEVLNSIPEELNTECLSAKSRAKYEMTYMTFKKWRNTSKNMNKLTCENALMVYFKELSQTCQPSTLWAKWSMLKTTLGQKDGIDINQYQQLKDFLKHKSDGYKCTKSKVLSADEIDKFITEAPNDKYLATKVALIFGISGSCRPNNLVQIMLKDVQHQGDIIVVKIPGGTNRKVPRRTFIIEGQFARLVKYYESMRPSNVISDRFFIRYQNGRCTAEPIGKNKFGAMPKRIAEYLKLPDASLYTGHSFRRISATVFAHSGTDLVTDKVKVKKSTPESDIEEDSIDDKSGIKHLIELSSVCDVSPPTGVVVKTEYIEDD